jgi:hypothetical protein
MSTQNNDGGPAFPCETYGIRNGKETTIPTNGMTLRDYFATKAMAGMLSSNETDLENTVSCNVAQSNLARAAYAIADIMLAAREASK